MLRRVSLQSSNRRVIVSTPARIHFGILDPFGSAGTRKYMSIGLAVREPRTVVEACMGSSSSIPGEVEREVSDVLLRLKAVYDIDTDNIGIRVLSYAPRHVGLGSTTQLKLAIAYSVLRLVGLSPDIVEIARLLGRGEVSGVGTYVFAYGGLVLDSGKKSSDDFPKLMLRVSFPEDWYVVIVIPPGRGPSEIEEHKLFSQAILKPELVYYAHYLVLNRIIPAVQDRDFEEFTTALEELQITVGKMFSLAQGGVFSQGSSKYVSKLRSLGLRGVGQSSWGPAVYGFTESRRLAESVCLEIRENNTQCIVTQADNAGARVYYVPTD